MKLDPVIISGIISAIIAGFFSLISGLLSFYASTKKLKNELKKQRIALNYDYFVRRHQEEIEMLAAVSDFLSTGYPKNQQIALAKIDILLGTATPEIAPALSALAEAITEWDFDRSRTCFSAVLDSLRNRNHQ